MKTIPRLALVMLAVISLLFVRDTNLYHITTSLGTLGFLYIMADKISEEWLD